MPIPNNSAAILPAWFEVLYEDNHLLAVTKPAGIATMGVKPERISLLTTAKQYVGQRYNKPGNVYLGVVSRLDAPVTGVVLFARTSKAAARLTEQFRARSVEKIYWALVTGAVKPPSGRWEDFVGEDKRHRRVHIVDAGAPGAKAATLAYRKMAKLEKAALVEITLETGRKHQIRVQCAHHGCPVVGDRKYGNRETFPAGIALHARRLVVSHPTTNDPVVLVAPLPHAWRRYGVDETWEE